MMRKTVILILCTILYLWGCVIAPGYRTPPEDGVAVIPITSQLIHQQQLRDLEVAQLPRADRDRRRYEYRIGPQDILSIVVWDHPEFAFPVEDDNAGVIPGYVVEKDGTIFFPYVGKVSVAGKTTAEVRQLLTRKLVNTVIDAQIDVKVVNYRSKKVNVAGEVSNPGRQPITDVPLNLLDAIGLAGGTTNDADLINVTLVRNDKAYDIDLMAAYKSGNAAQVPLLEDGDILYVPSKSLRKIFMVGELGRQSSLLMDRRRISLTEAISDSGGINLFTSNPSRIFVIRGGPTGAEVYQLNARKPDALVLGEGFQLKPRDIVYVDTAGVTRWSRVINQILPTVSFVGTNINRFAAPQ